MHKDFAGQVALITGLAPGIGLVVAEGLADEGGNICGTDGHADLLQNEMARIAEK